MGLLFFILAVYKSSMEANNRKAVFLDRDGVINQLTFRDSSPSAPFTEQEFIFLPSIKEAIKLFKDNGFLCVVVTNQPDVERGNLPEEVLRRIHIYMQKETGIDAAYFCPHSNDGQCECRKPKPGMIHQAVKDLKINLSESWMIGDRWRDVEMGKTAGVKTILVETDSTRHDNRELFPDYRVKDLLEAARIIAG